MKQRQLVSYDYGQGALWAFVLAESADEIRRRHPELKIVDAPPAWMTKVELSEIETIDIDRPEGTWLAIPPSDDPGD
jgi:hypothetical protein